jgi:Leucine-rich repeat (LRR) protein
MLESLPELPYSLQYLNCNNNKLKSFPNIPSSVIEIDCSNNQLEILEIPITLKKLSCYNNFLAFQDLKSYYYQQMQKK